MSYWQLFYHIVWATAERLPLLTPDVEEQVYGYLRSKAVGLEGVVFAVNGMPDHVHMLVSIPPKVAVAQFIGQVKSVAATKHNKNSLQELPLAWQHEYGVFSFDGKRLPNYISYVERQKFHHAEGQTIPILERTHDGEVRRVAENAAPYVTDDEAWRRDLEALEPMD